MEIRKLHSFAGQSVDVRCGELRASIATRVSIAHVVDHDDHEVRTNCCFGSNRTEQCDVRDDRDTSPRGLTHVVSNRLCAPSGGPKADMCRKMPYPPTVLWTVTNCIRPNSLLVDADACALKAAILTYGLPQVITERTEPDL